MTLCGLHVPVVTPFTAAGRVDAGSLERLARRCLDAGAEGLVALATTGEGGLLDEGERRQVLEVCRAVTIEYGAILTVGAGTMGTEESIAQARERAAMADALLVVVPYYLRPTDEGVIDHFAAVGKAVDVPLIAYDIPYRTGKRLELDSLLRLLDLECVAGVKHCPGAIGHDTLRLLAARTGKAVLCGDDAYVHPMMLLGAAGAVTASACLVPDAYAALAGDLTPGCGRNTELHDALLPLVDALFSEPSPSVLKAVLAETGVIEHPHVRAPLHAPAPGTVSRARACLEAVEEISGRPRRPRPRRAAGRR
ncbi:dihydrodipicolinate synthase family protein [Actinomadura miaoliensis]|uniref:4-hydroxy-tetrahydrodipicolinate synthase n=1 Tax=Actinomadura miaoliensis TaxID=430685 RepID=A0ABP7W461_9ACTN